MSRIARAVFRLTRAFGADPDLSLSQPEVEYLAELDRDELAIVIDAMVTGGALVREGSVYHAGAGSAPLARAGVLDGGQDRTAPPSPDQSHANGP